LRIVESCIQFVIGDWLNYGERTYGEKYSRALDETDYAYGGLANFSYVANRIEISRRRENLSFSHHQEIAPFELEKQEYWLDKAVKEHLTQRELRRAIIEERYRELPIPEAPEGKFNVIYADPLTVMNILFQIVEQ